MKITVVTVCYNAEHVIADTIESVLSQDYKEFEYIIKDGNSTDKTCHIISNYLYDERIIYTSNPDTGLYNAMNIATEKASGDYIIFMNAGDVFYSSNTLSKIFNNYEGSADIIYGDTLRHKQNYEQHDTYKNKSILKMLLCGKMMCHQSMFVKTDLMYSFKFNENFTITADFDFVVRAYSQKKNFEYINLVVSKVESVNGISFQDNNLITMRKQDDLSLKSNLPIWYYLIYIPKSIYRRIQSH